MPCPTVYIPKFVGTITVGLLTGTSYAAVTASIPPLLALPSLAPARQSFASLRKYVSAQQNVLSIASVSAIMLAFLRSKRSAKHPYMVWTSLAIAGGSLTKYFLMNEDNISMRLSEGTTDESEINGEVVREEMENWRYGQMVSGGLWGLAWVMMTVGIWGDGA